MARPISITFAQISCMSCQPVVILSMSALMRVNAAAGSTAVMLRSVVLVYSIDTNPPRAMVMAR